jgi:DNA polymerase IV (DinB-like DNA polymerase)
MRIIGHLDMDAFFASIEERDHPRLRGLPIVIGADPEDGRGRGVVSTANYAARKYGIRSALPITAAWRFSEAARKKGLPPAVFMGVDMEKYVDVSRRVMEVLRGVLGVQAAIVEQASVDEAYFDLSFTGTYEKACEVARAVKQEIKARENLTASVGIGPNKLIAKIAADMRKPDGLTIVRGDVSGEAEKFLAPMSIRVIPGVGPKTEARFAALRVRTVADAKRFTAAELTDMMGKWGVELYEKLRGRDDAPLVTEWVAKSVGEQTTFAHDLPAGSTAERKVLTDALTALADDVYLRLKDVASFRAVTVTVRFADFTTRTRSTTLPEPAASGGSQAQATLQFQALRLFMPFLDRRENPGRKAIRLIGIRVEKLVW